MTQNRFASLVFHYVIATLVVLFAFAIRLSLHSTLGENAPLIVFTLAVMLAAWRGGLGPGLWATALSTLFSIYYFIPPIASFRIEDRADGVHVLIFAFIGVAVSWMCERQLHGDRVLARSLAERREAQESQKFLLEIAEDIRQAENAGDLLFAVLQAVGEHLQVRRCLFNEIDLANDRETVHRDYCRGVESVAGVHRLSDYSSITLAEMKAGRTVVNRDSQTDPRTADFYERTYAKSGERAYVAAPLLRQGRWVSTLWVSDDRPRDWSEQEIGLLETVAERAWLAVEKLRSETALREGEEKFRTLADNMSQFAWMADKKGWIFWYNKRWYERWFGTNTDITEAKQIEQEREQILKRERTAREQAEAHNRAKDEFLAVVTHELRSPLNAILGYTRLARSDAHDASQVVQHCNIIERAARTQQQLIDDLLDTARIITGKLRIDARPCDLRLVLEEALTVVRPAAEAKGIQLRIEYGGSRMADGGSRVEEGREGERAGERETGRSSILDPRSSILHPPSSIKVMGDAARLQQVVWNLLQNAVKFTPVGGRVELRTEQTDRHVRISVTDNGKGIEPEFLPAVFDRFSQNDMSRTRRHGGLGLGLALVKQLVELHGGEIEVTSEGAGRGATFTVTLPLGAPQVERASPMRALAAEVSPEVSMDDDEFPMEDLPSLAGVRVLAVDDEEEARHLIAMALGKLGASVTTAASGAEALDFLAGSPPAAKPDVLLLDISMPDEDGYAVLCRVRALEAARGVPEAARIPAIALTAHTRSQDRLAALSAGFQMYVGKPVELAELVVVIASIVGQKGMGAQFSG